MGIFVTLFEGRGMAAAYLGEGSYGPTASVTKIDSDHPGRIVVPDAQLLFTAHFHRAGPDLVLTGRDGHNHIIPGYFSGGHRPALFAPNGAMLSPDLVDLLAGSPTPNEYAQAGQITPPDSIGRVEKVVGNVTVVRNGTAVTLNVGDAVYKSDVVQTDANSSVGIGFPDGSAINLVANTRMALSEYSYDSNSTSNSALFNLVEGGLSFVAGKVAHTGDMKIGTPVALLGIRGTAGWLYEDATVTSQAGSVTLHFGAVFDSVSNTESTYTLYAIDASGQLQHDAQGNPIALATVTSTNGQVATLQETPAGIQVATAPPDFTQQQFVNNVVPQVINMAIQAIQQYQQQNNQPTTPQSTSPSNSGSSTPPPGQPLQQIINLDNGPLNNGSTATVTVAVNNSQPSGPPPSLIPQTPQNVVQTTAPTTTSTTTPLTATPAVLVADGTTTTTLTVTAEDANGNPVSNATVTLTATGTGNTFTSPITGTTNAEGVFTTTLKSAVAQSDTFTAVINGTASVTASVNFTAGPASQATSSLTATPSTLVANGTTLTVTAEDAHGNLIPNAAVTLTATGTGNTFTSPISGTTNADGVFTTTVESTVAQSDTFTAVINGTANESASLDITAGPVSQATSSVTATSAMLVADGTTTTLTVTAEDAQGNLIPFATVTLTATGTGNTFTSPITGTTNAEGVFTTTVQSTVAQRDTFTALIGGTASETASVDFTAGAASQATSSLTASPGTLAANGTSTTTLTVTAEDAHGNLIPNASVTLTGTGTGNTFTSPITGTTNAEGVFTATLESTVAQSDAFTALIGGTASETATVNFTTVSETVLPITVAENTAIGLGTYVTVADTPNTGDPLSMVLTVTNGTITAGDATGASVTLTGTAAQITAALSTASYSGNTNYFGPDSLTVATTDTANGSTVSKTAAITVGDTTTVSETVLPITVAENTAIGLGTYVTVADTPNTGDPLSMVLTVTNGTITAGDATGASVTLTGTAAQITAALSTASYSGNTNYFGPDSLTVATTDTANGSTVSKTAAITVGDTTTVSETVLPITVAENTAIGLGTYVTVADTPNTGDPLSMVLTVTNGTITAGDATGASVTLTGTAAQITAALSTASYSGNTNYFGPDSLTVATTDTANGSTVSKTAAITVGDTTTVSETVLPITVAENTAIGLGTYVTVADTPNTGDPLSMVLTVTNGTITAGDATGASVTLTGTAAQITAALSTASYSGNTNYFGPDSLTVATTDTANGSTVSKTAAITVGDTTTVSETVLPITVAENTAIGLGTYVTVADTPNTGDPLSMVLTVTNGTITAGDATGASVTLTGTAAQITAALSTASYSGNTNYFGPDSLTVATTDTANGSTVSKTAAITVGDTTTVSETVLPITVAENTAIGLGTYVTVADTPNTGDPLSMVLTVTNGTITAGDATGASVTLTGTAAQITAALSTASYSGNTNYFGPDSLTVATTDTANGSTVSKTAAITVGDTTTVSETVLPITVAENTAIGLGTYVTVADTPNTGDPLSMVLTVTNGTITAGDATGASVTLTGTAAQITAALSTASYSGNTNYFGPDSLTVATTDTANGSTVSKTAAITVGDTTTVSETVLPITVAENTAIGLGTYVTVADTPNTGDPLSMVLTVTNGTITAGDATGASVTLTGTAAQITAALSTASYSGNTNYFGPDSLTVATTDTANGSTVSKTAAITVGDTTTVSETVLPITVAENTAIGLGTYVTVADTPNTGDPLSMVLTVTNGTITAGDATGASVTLTGTAAQITAALSTASYSGNTNYFGPDSLTVATTDTANGSTVSKTAAITVGDTTTVSETVLPITVAENTAIGLGTYVTVADTPNTGDPLSMVLTVTNGTITAGDATGASVTLTGTAAQITAALSTASYSGNTNYFGPDSLTVATTDTANGSTVSKTAAITVGDTTTVSETVLPITVAENTAIGLGTYVTVADTPNTGDPLSMVLTVTNGTITAGDATGASVTLTGTAAQITAALSTASYSGNTNYFGPDSLTVATTDTANGSTVSKTAAITVGDTTTVSETVLPITVAENTAIGLGTYVTVADTPNTGDPLSMVLTVTNGTITAGDATGASVTLTGTAAQITAALSTASYSGNTNYFGPDSLTVATTDTANGSTVSKTAAITVGDTTTVSETVLPITVAENTAIGLGTYVTVADTPNTGDPLSMVLTVTNGTITAGDATGASVTLTGTAAQITAALSTASYSGNTNYFGPDSLTVATTDTANGSTVSKTAAITVGDTTTVSETVLPITVAENTAIGLGTYVTVADTPNTGDPLSMVLTVTNGTITAGDATGASVTLTGTAAQITAALSTASYSGNTNYFGPDSLTVATTDTANGSTVSKTAAITVGDTTTVSETVLPITVAENTAIGLGTYVTVADTPNTGDPLSMVLTVTNGTITAGDATGASVTLTGTAAQITAALSTASYSGNTNYFGPDSLTVATTDTANGSTVSKTAAITVGDTTTVSETVLPITVAENTAIGLGTYVTVADTPNTGDPLSMVLTVTNGTITAGDATGASVTLTGTAAQITAALSTASYSGNTNYFGPDSLTVATTDTANGSTVSKTAAITVGDTTTVSETVLPITVAENTAIGLGTYVTVADTPNTGDPLSMVLTVTNGTITAGDATGASVTLTGTAAQITAALSTASYSGNTNYFGPDSLTVATTDTANGSTVSKTAAITVGDTTTVSETVLPITVAENTAIGLGTYVTVADTPNTGDPLSMVLTVTNGTITAGDATGASVTLTGTAAQITAALSTASYSGNTNYFGPDSLTVATTDTANGSTVSKTAAITVGDTTTVSETVLPITVAENTAIGLGTYVTVADTPNTGDPLSMVLTVTNGTITAGDATGASVTLTGTAAQITAALSTASYSGNTNYFGPDSLTVATTDTANGSTVSKTAAITVGDTTTVSETVLPITVAENTAIGLGTYVTVADTPNTGDPLSMVLTVTNGTITAGDATGASVTLTGTAAQITAALSTASYSGNTNYFGPDSLTVATTDTANGSTVSKTAAITVGDTTTVSETVLPITVAENTAIGLGTYVTVADTPNTGDPLSMVLTVTNGTITAGDATGASVTLTGTAAQITAALSTASYSGNTNYFGPDSLTVATTDTANGSTVSKTAAITVGDTTTVSETVLPITVAENTAIGLGTYVTVADTPNTGDPLSMVLTVTNGTITAGDATGASVTLTGTAAQITAALSTASYSGNTNYFGPDSLTVATTDTANGSTVSKTAAITVGDTTTVSETVLPITVAENTAIGLGTYVTVADTPNTGDPLSMVLTVTNGTITAGDATGASVTLTGTAAQITAALSTASYSGNTNYFGPDSLTVATTDTANGSTVSKTAAITVGDTTTVSETVLPITVAENTAIGLGTYVTVADTPNTGDPLSMVLTVTNGTITAGDATGASVTLTGTAAQITAALSTASYSGNTNYFGPDSLTVATTDTANGSTVSKTAAITVGDTLAVSASVVGGVAVQEGQTLVAQTTLNIDNATINYQWQELINGVWTNVNQTTVGDFGNSGAESSFLQLTEADEGYQFRVQGSFTTNGQTTTATSAAVGPVADVTPEITVPFNYAVDDLSITKGGTITNGVETGGSQIYNDAFNQTGETPPPASPDANGTPVVFNTLGSVWTEGTNNAGQPAAILSSTGVAPTTSGSGNAEVVAVLNTNTLPQGTGSGQSNSGLKENATYTVSATFDLTAPPTGDYGLQLTDGTSTHANDQLLGIWVQRLSNGNTAVELVQNDPVADTPATVLDSQILTSTDLAPGNQIELQLIHAANSTAITGTFDVISGGSVIDTMSWLSPTNEIYTTSVSSVTWAQADVIALTAPGVGLNTLSPHEDQVLTASATTNDADAIINFQWEKSSSSSFSSVTYIGANSEGTQNNGIWTSTYTVQPADVGDYIRVVATTSNSDNPQSGTANPQSGTATSSVTGAVLPVAPTLTITTPTLTVGEDGTVAVGISETPFDTRDIVSVTISGAPTDSTLSSAADPTGISYTAETNTWTVASAALADLQLNAGEVTSASLTVTATNTEGTTASSAEKTITLNVTPEAPTLTVTTPTLTVSEDGTVAVGISETPFDTRDIVSVTITGVPTDATLSDSNGDTLMITDGSITLTPAELAGLTLHAGQTSGALIVTATNTEGTTVPSAPQTITLNLIPVAQTDEWLNTSGGTWTDATDASTNWSTGALPRSIDAVLIDKSGTYTVNIPGGGAAVGSSLTLSNADATLSDQGSLTLNGTLTIDAGTFVLSGGGTLSGETVIDLEDAIITGGATIANSGTINVSGTSTLENGIQVSGGALSIGAGATLKVEGTGATLNDVNVTLATGAIVQVDPSLTVKLVLSGGTTISGGTIQQGASSGAVEISAGSGGSGATLDGVTVNNIPITVDGSVTLTLDGGTAVSGNTITNSGIILVTGPSAIDNATISNASGEINLIGATLTLDDTTLNSGTITGSDGGAISVDLGDMLTLNGVTASGSGTGTVNNSGMVSLSGTSLTLGGSGFTLALDGAGTLALNGKTLKVTGTGDSLDNNGNTISGPGQIGSGTSNALALDNISGTIEAIGGTLKFAIGSPITNSGLLQAANTGSLDVTSSTVNNNGTNPLAPSGATGILVTGTFVIDNPTTAHQEVILAGSGSGVVALNGGTIEGNSANAETLDNSNNLIFGFGNIGIGTDQLTLQNDATGTIEAQNGVLAIHTGHTVINAGTLEAGTGGSLQIDDTVTNTGSIQALGGAHLVFDNATISNLGTIALAEGSLGSFTSLIIQGTLTLQNAGGAFTLATDSQIVSNLSAATLISVNDISGAGTIGDLFLTFDNDAGGTVDATGFLTLNAGSLDNEGLLEATAGNGGELLVHSIVDNAGGTVAASGGFVDFELGITGGGATISDNGKLEYGWLSTVNTTFDGPGTLVLDHQNQADLEFRYGVLYRCDLGFRRRRHARRDRSHLFGERLCPLDANHNRQRRQRNIGHLQQRWRAASLPQSERFLHPGRIRASERRRRRKSGHRCQLQ